MLLFLGDDSTLSPADLSAMESTDNDQRFTRLHGITHPTGKTNLNHDVSTLFEIRTSAPSLPGSQYTSSHLSDSLYVPLQEILNTSLCKVRDSVSAEENNSHTDALADETASSELTCFLFIEIIAISHISIL